MESNTSYASDVAFTPTVKAVQARKGSRRSYKRMEQGGSWETTVTPELAEFIAAQTSVYLASATGALSSWKRNCSGSRPEAGGAVRHQLV